MQFNKNPNFKMYLFIAICMIVILTMWIYTLKLNLSKSGNLADSFKDIFKKTEQEQKQPEITDELINKLASELKKDKEEIDISDWQVYRNEELGFEIKYFFEESFSILENKEENIVCFRNSSLIGDCERTSSSPMYSEWSIYIQDNIAVENLDQFIKKIFGKGCGYSSMIETDNSGTYDIKIIGDGKPIIESLCFPNYSWYIKYSPSHKRVAYWHHGQLSFFPIASDQLGYDKKMSQTFKFLD